MPQSLVKNYIHIIFSTKSREPRITPDIEKQLYNYLGASCLDLGCNAKRVGGHIDHVHLLCNLSKNISASEFIKEIKQWSSKWIKSEYSKNGFYWQAGYAAFSINKDSIQSVVDYIDQQHVHHQTQSFQEELRQLLTNNDVVFDERYVWD